MIIEYVFLVTFFLVLGIAAYIRIRHPFWSIQPVFHTYDFWRYWFVVPYVIQEEYPARMSTTYNKFLQYGSIKTQYFLDATDAEQARILDLIQCHYLRSPRVLYTMDMSDLRIQCSSHISAPCLVSLYSTQQWQPSGVNLVVAATPNVGVLVAYPVRFAFRGQPLMSVFYWEYIVIHREEDRDPKHARTLIQTHEANQRRLHPDIPVSIFRKDVDLSEGIRPFIIFPVARFEVVASRIGKPPLAPHCTVTRIERESMHRLMDFFYDMTNNTRTSFDMYIFPEMPALQSRIESNQWLFYTMQSRDQLLAVYAFKDTKVVYEEHSDAASCLELMCSQSLMDVNDDKAFFAGWLHAMHDILQYSRHASPQDQLDQQQQQIGFITIPQIGHNDKLLDMWKWKYAPRSTHDAAIYFYNYVCPMMRTNHSWITL